MPLAQRPRMVTKPTNFPKVIAHILELKRTLKFFRSWCQGGDLKSPNSQFAGRFYPLPAVHASFYNCLILLHYC